MKVKAIFFQTSFGAFGRENIPKPRLIRVNIEGGGVLLPQ